MILSTFVNVIASDPVAAADAWMSTLSPEQTAKSNQYFEGRYWLLFWNLLLEIIVAWLLLANQRSARFAKWLGSKLPNWLVKPSYILTYTFVVFLLFLPFAIYQNYFRELQYDLMNLSLGAWFGEELISLLLSAIIGTLAIWGIYALIRKLGDAWRWWGAGATIAFLAFMMMIGPVFLAPIFNDYTPMEEGPLRTEILAMAEANGVPADNVYVFNISKQTNKVTANVSGFLGTTRISLSDTLLERTTPGGIKSVMAHELGHYTLGHVYERLVYFGLVILFGFIFAHAAYKLMHRRFGEKWGIGAISDIAGMPLFFGIMALYFFIATPVTNSIIRSNEVEADYFGLNAAAEPDGFAQVSLMLAEYRKMKPGPWEEFFFHDHPSGYNRILMAMKWKSAHEVIDATELEDQQP